MNYSLKTCLLFILILLIGTLPLYAAAPSEVQKAAQSGLERFRSTIPAQEMARMGLVTAEEVTAAVFRQSLERICDFARLPSGLQVRNVHLFLIDRDRQLDLSRTGERPGADHDGGFFAKWELGSNDLWGHFLPQRLQEVQGRMGTLLGQKGISRQSGFTLRFVRVYQAQAEFMAVLGGNTEYLLPLMPNPSRMNMAADTLLAADQVIPQLKQEVQNSIEQWNVRKRKTR